MQGQQLVNHKPDEDFGSDGKTRQPLTYLAKSCSLKGWSWAAF